MSRLVVVALYSFLHQVRLPSLHWAGASLLYPLGYRSPICTMGKHDRHGMLTHMCYSRLIGLSGTLFITCGGLVVHRTEYFLLSSNICYLYLGRHIGVFFCLQVGCMNWIRWSAYSVELTSIPNQTLSSYKSATHPPIMTSGSFSCMTLSVTWTIRLCEKSNSSRLVVDRGMNLLYLWVSLMMLLFLRWVWRNLSASRTDSWLTKWNSMPCIVCEQNSSMLFVPSINCTLTVSFNQLVFWKSHQSHKCLSRQQTHFRFFIRHGHHPSCLT